MSLNRLFFRLPFLIWVIWIVATLIYFYFF